MGTESEVFIFCSNLQGSNPLSLLSKTKRSPSRRSKSRWEPLPVEKPADATPPYSNGTAAKYDGWANVSERDKKVVLFIPYFTIAITLPFCTWFLFTYVYDVV